LQTGEYNPLKTNLPKTGFTENKGQLSDQTGHPNADVLYSKDFGGMKVQLSTQFS
jgi:hypothetical protein